MEDKRVVRGVAWAMLAFLLGGCEGRVVVTDALQRPIEGAWVVPVTLSMSGNATQTNGRGEARVARRVGTQPTRWVRVWKEGYGARDLAAPERWPLTVVLEQEGAEGPALAEELARFGKLHMGMAMAEGRALVGQPAHETGSGVAIDVYVLRDGSEVLVGYAGRGGLLYARRNGRSMLTENAH